MSAVVEVLEQTQMVMPPRADAIVVFDYSALPAEQADSAKQAAERIRNRLRIDYIETGRDLIAVKKSLNHGQFGAWLEAELGLDRRSAARYMAAAEFVTANWDTVSHLQPGLVQALAAPSLPKLARELCLNRVRADDPLKPKDISVIATEARDVLRAKSNVRRIGPGRRERAAKDDEAAREAEELRFRKAEAKRHELARLLVDALGERCGEALALLKDVSGYIWEDTFRAALAKEVARQDSPLERALARVCETERGGAVATVEVGLESGQ